MRKFFLLILVLVKFLFVAMLGFLFFPAWGEYCGALIFLILFIINIVLGDRLLLVLLEGKRPENRDGMIFDTIKNIAYFKQVAKLELYFSKKFTNQLFIINKTKNNFFLVIGQNVKNKLSKEELTALIEYSFESIARGDTQITTLFTLVSFLHLPLLTFFNFKKMKWLRFFEILFFYIKTPFDFFRFKILSFLKCTKPNMENVFLESAFFKIKKMNAKTQRVKGQYIMDYLGVVPLYRLPSAYELISMAKPVKVR